MQIDDCYRVLEIEKTHDKHMIKSAYRKLAKIHHPDANHADVDNGEFLRYEIRFHFAPNAIELYSGKMGIP